MKVLVVEDDQTLNKNIKESLEAEGWQTEVVFDGTLAEKILKKGSFDCVIMDVNIPGKNGYEVCKSFRTFDTHTPVIYLTAFDELEDKVEGYNSGGDDYLTKPFFMKELIIRINSLVKRSTGKETEKKQIIHGDITINLETKEVRRNNTLINLTPREYQIILRLAEAKGQLVLKQDLVREIWGNSVETNTNTIEVYINFLRNKLDKPFDRPLIKTKIGYGYFLEV